MTRLLQLSLMTVATSFALAVAPSGASAQSACGGGRAANGDCVNEALAVSAIQTAVTFSQAKISLTAYPVLPSADRLYRYPNQLIPNQLPPTRIAPPPPPPPSGG
jgi:hypothetical protein